VAAQRALVRAATVDAIDGASVTLATADGWTKTIDVTSVPITRGGSPVTVAELAVGMRMRVAERRGDDGSWQVTRLAVVLTNARGSVASVGDDGFQLTTDGSASITVRTSDDTTWLSGCQPGGDLASLQVGAVVVVRGVAAEDGSIDATAVSVAAERPRMRRQRDGRVPSPVPVASPAPSVPSA
jgi:hypothetical protein